MAGSVRRSQLWPPRRNEPSTVPPGKWKVGRQHAYDLARNVAEANGGANHAGIAVKQVPP